MFPIRAKLIVLFPFYRIAEDFVGLVDIFELFFSRFVSPGLVGMIFVRKRSIRFLYLSRRRCLFNTQNLIVIFVGHSRCVLYLFKEALMQGIYHSPTRKFGSAQQFLFRRRPRQSSPTTVPASLLYQSLLSNDIDQRDERVVNPSRRTACRLEGDGLRNPMDVSRLNNSEWIADGNI